MLSNFAMQFAGTVSQMIIEKVTTQNSGVRINWNMFWMQMENNWLLRMCFPAIAIAVAIIVAVSIGVWV